MLFGPCQALSFVAVPERAALTRQEQQERTRHRLVSAAASVFASRGYQAASVDEVAHEAGYSSGAVYSNFSGKEELFLAVMERAFATLTDDVMRFAELALARRPDDYERQAASWFSSLLDEHSEWPLLFHEFWIHAMRNPELGPQLEARRIALRDAIADAIERVAAEQGTEPRFPPQRLAALTTAMVTGLSFELAANPDLTPELAAFALATVQRASLGLAPRNGAG